MGPAIAPGKLFRMRTLLSTRTTARRTLTACLIKTLYDTPSVQRVWNRYSLQSSYELVHQKPPRTFAPPPSPKSALGLLAVQVYNENIRDLLNDTGEFLDLREDPIKVSGATGSKRPSSLNA